MPATLLYRTRQPLSETLSAELSVWDLPEPVRGSAHRLKYRLALIANGHCVLRYDNEAGKGDHKHLGPSEIPYCFVDLPTLLADFWRDVAEWRMHHEHAND